jgi:hypothetical protein
MMVAPSMRDLWEAGKPFLTGFRRHFAYLVPAIFLVPFELYERVVRPNFGTDTWPEHLLIPAAAFPWVLLATVLWTAFLTYRDLYKEKVQLERIHLVQSRHEEGTPANVQPEPSQHEDRTLANITLDKLRDFYRDRTQTEGDRLAAPYVNKWVTVEGKVYDAHMRSIINNCEVVLSPDGDTSLADTKLYFAERWRDRVELLRRGDVITVEGKILYAARMQVALDDCALINGRDLNLVPPEPK